ncbi:MAG: DUF5329 domain-containing protein [Candidatus Electrothrix sp. GW3-4]|uniref:DUF5329 domain-containing protein n=1 Tax=Candidatus Electrothrix sp. GW3-4 TaxID=3126740 RepID=UPI0030CF2E1D
MKYLTGCILVLLLTTSAHTDVPPDQQTEVAHLLRFVKKSPCTINRNGTRHQGEEAAEHIQKKYDYFRKKIKTTEDFIEYSASKSTMSGKYYTVHCGGQKPIWTRDWLLKELEKYRGERGQHPLQQQTQAGQGGDGKAQ